MKIFPVTFRPVYAKPSDTTSLRVTTSFREMCLLRKPEHFNNGTKSVRSADFQEIVKTAHVDIFGLTA